MGIRTLENVSGIILQTRPYGESHRTAVLLTERHGAVRAIAYGAQKARGPLYSSVQALVSGLFLLRLQDGAPGEIVQGVVVDMYDALRSDLRKAAYAQAVLELALAACRDDAHPVSGRLYQATVAALDELIGGNPGRLALARMGLAVAVELGVAVACEQCAECGSHLAFAGQCYSASAGGLLCARCADACRSAAALRMDAEAASLLASLCAVPKPSPALGDEQSLRQVLKVVLAHLTEYGGIVLKSLRVLDAIDG